MLEITGASILQDRRKIRRKRLRAILLLEKDQNHLSLNFVKPTMVKREFDKSAPRTPTTGTCHKYLRCGMAKEFTDGQRAFHENLECGRLTNSGAPCKCVIEREPCPFHNRLEQRDMEAADRESLKIEKGICGKVLPSGLCEQVRGRCAFHAQDVARCTSTIDSDPSKQC